MKKQRVLALLLCLTLLCTLIPGVFAANDNTSSNGMEISKTATANGNGTYTVTLEAYATGSKIISEVKKDIPTDIVLVLDQSGSMAEKFSTVTVDSYPEYSGTNADFYNNRNNIYYKLADGGYVKVTVNRLEGETTEKFNKVSNGYNANLKNLADQKNLYYQMSNGNYKLVTVKEKWPDYTYTYINDSGNEEKIESSKWAYGTPGEDYYSKETVTNYKYTYSYTAGGETITIEVSEGSTNTPAETFYKKTTKTQNLTRLDALKNAVTTFADNVAQKAAGADRILGTEDDVNHRIAIAGFSSSGYDNTELLTGVEITTGDYRGATPNTNDNYYFPTGYEKNGASYYDSGITAEQYGKALQNMNESAGQQNVSNGIAAITAEGGTMINQGLDMANQIFKNNSVIEGKRNRVIVVFTDGAPGVYGNWQQASRDTANSALSNAYISKNTYNATVYTVGVFSGADASNPSSLPDYTTSSSPSASEQTKNSNRFMHLLSSNYPEATKMNSTGSINPNLAGKSYYLSAGDADTLNNIFQQISDQIESGGSSSTLSEETVIKDIISPAFTLPEGASASDITLETYQCTGKSGEKFTFSDTPNETAMGAKATVDGAQVSVTGFNFADNYVGPITENGNVTYRGHKLVISFTVSPKAGFLGGNNVYTNTSAGVYENSSAREPVMEFPQPQVNVPIKNVTVTAADKNVYLLGSVTADQLKDGATVTVGDVALNLDPNATNYGLEPWQTEYVDITVKYYGADGTTEITDLNKLEEDTTYSISVTVAPKYGGAGADGTPAVAMSGENDPAAKINVFKPELTFKDSEVYYGESVPKDYTGNKVSEVWKHGNTASTDEGVTMLGTAPTLTLTDTPDSTKIADGKINTKQDVPVDVAVKIGKTDSEGKTTYTDVTSNTTFVHNNCSGKTCTLPAGKEFLLHVKTCQLTVTKDGGAADEPYVFTVKKDGTKYTEVTVVGNGSETICELPVGTYTIEEDTSWSWRYSADDDSSVSLSAEKSTGSITCENTMKKPYWLNGFSAVAKNISGISNISK